MHQSRADFDERQQTWIKNELTELQRIKQENLLPEKSEIRCAHVIDPDETELFTFRKHELTHVPASL